MRVLAVYERADLEAMRALQEALAEHEIELVDLLAGPFEIQMSKASACVFALSRSSVVSAPMAELVSKIGRFAADLELDFLCPVGLDDAWRASDWLAWGPVLKRQVLRYQVLDFSQWADPSALAKSTRRLAQGLREFYG